ncbi:MAG TPA: VOC family protein [Acidimicrobiales bacterium]|nr:VOC family protein [Acidimicrobiales bacterium]
MAEEPAATFNHVGHCVTDLAAAERFYTELFGFETVGRLHPPDGPTGRLLGIDPPVGLTAVYLRRGGLVLELLHFDRPGNPPYRPRVVNEPGLTHLSFSVPDPAATARRAADLGGEVLEATAVGMGAVLIRDPGGQLIELLSHPL